jgi:AGZA family xanthine/uracil permease-like MFS transporter
MADMAFLWKYFALEERGSTVGRELRGALATFLTMAYILVANANILGEAGVPRDSVIACTALAAGVCCIMMGLVANFPLALASGMGLNSIVAIQIIPVVGSWQAAMGLIVLDGLAVLVLVLTGLRQAVLHAIPRDLRLAIGAGIGLFIAFIGAVNAGIAVPGKDQPLTYGSVTLAGTALAIFGLLLTAILMARRITGALVIGIIVTTLLALIVPGGVARLPEQWGPPRFETLLAADVLAVLHWKYLPWLFAIMMVDFFDTVGTASAIADQAGLHDKDGRIIAAQRVLIVDSLSASVGGLCGVSSVTSYIESAAGVSEGARTGLHSVFVGLMFLAAIALAPLAAVVPPQATAPALILVGFLMLGQVARINFSDLEMSIPAFVTLLVIPLTWSIAHGIGYGFIVFVIIKLAVGKYRQVHPLMYVVAAAFAAYFVLGKG